jgi:hypothetical protein
MYPFKVKVETESNLGAASIEASETDFGLCAGLGFLFGSPRSQLRAGMDGRFHIIMTEGETTNVIAMMGRLFF